MLVSGRAATLAILASLSLFASGCPQFGRVSPTPAPTPVATAPAPRIHARVNPVFRLVIPPRPLDEPTRLVALFVRIENIDQQPLLIRPDLLRLQLPDGSTRHALDKARASEIMSRSVLARYNLAYLANDPSAPPGGLSLRQLSYWTDRVHSDLLADVRLEPRETVEGFVVLDTGHRLRSLQDTAVEAFAQDVQTTGHGYQYGVRVPVGAPIEVGP